MWRVELRGGAFDGWSGRMRVEGEPPLRLVVWVCDVDECPGHATCDAHEPAINLRTAEAYRRVEVDIDTRTGRYEVGEGDPSGKRRRGVAHENFGLAKGVLYG